LKIIYKKGNKMNQITSIEELRRIADDVQVVSDGSYGYIIALLSNVEVDEVVEAITPIKFTIVRDDLIVSEPVEGGIPDWI